MPVTRVFQRMARTDYLPWIYQLPVGLGDVSFGLQFHVLQSQIRCVDREAGDQQKQSYGVKNTYNHASQLPVFLLSILLKLHSQKTPRPRRIPSGLTGYDECWTFDLRRLRSSNTTVMQLQCC